MKPHVTLYCIFIFLSACSSRKHTVDRSFLEDHESTVASITDEKIQTQKVTGVETDKSKQTNVSEHIRTISFDSTGRISSVQETRRQTRSEELESGSGRSSENTLTERSDSTSTESKTNIREAERTVTNDDNRPVQGKEWMYVFIPITIGVVVIILIAWLLNWLKKKRNKTA